MDKTDRHAAESHKMVIIMWLMIPVFLALACGGGDAGAGKRGVFLTCQNAIADQDLTTLEQVIPPRP